MYNSAKNNQEQSEDLPGKRPLVNNSLPKISIQIAQEQEILKKIEVSEAAVGGACEAVWHWDLVAHELYILGPWDKILGYSKQEINEISDSWALLLHPEDKERVFDSPEEFLFNTLEGNEYNLEFRLKHKNGTYRWIRSKGTVLRGEDGKPNYISGSHTDITSYKMAEQALMQSEQKYRNLFENSLVGMFRADVRTGLILEANAKAWEMFGLEPQKDIVLKDLFKNEEERELAMKELLRNNIIENHELEVKRWDGKMMWVSLSACYYPQEGLIEFVLKDITETKKSLLELQKVNFELDNFVYHASHDLRSPLRSILGLIHILRIEKSEKAKQNCIDMIEGSIKRLDNLVMDLLSMSRNNRVNDPHVSINFMNEIHYSFTNFYHTSDTKNLKITTKVHQPVAFISDVTRVRIILNNLISNAIKYRSFDRELSFIAIDVQVNEDEAVFVIEDNGEGIPKSKQSSIFDMFVRASESSEGSGLGLYIVKNVLEKLNGTVLLDSEENVGTKFTVRLPNTLRIFPNTI